jgi:beta-lactam-binding protein with PASTA domain
VTGDSRTGCLAGPSTPNEFEQTTYVTPGTQPSSCANPTTLVPSVLGYSGSSAEGRLESEGFAVVWKTQPEPNPGQANKNSGLVWKQHPAAGTTVDEGTTVTIFVNP